MGVKEMGSEDCKVAAKRKSKSAKREQEANLDKFGSSKFSPTAKVKEAHLDKNAEAKERVDFGAYVVELNAMSIKGIGNDPYGKIAGDRQDNLINRAQEANVDKSGSTEASVEKKGDEVNFSEDSKIMAEAYRTAMKTEDVRLDKVAEVKERIHSGTYSVDARKLAKNILSMEDDLFK